MKGRDLNFFGVAFKVVPLYFKNSPILAPVEQLFSFFHGLSWVFAIVATQRLFDAIADAGQQMADFRHVATALAVLGAVIFGQQILNGLANFLADQVSEKNIGRYWVNLQKKLQRVPTLKFEDTAFLDDIEKAKSGVEFLDYFSGVCMLLFMFYGVYFVGVGAYLFWLSPILPIVILASFVPALLAQIMRVRVFTKLEAANAPLRRKCDYYQKAIVDREYFKETRLLGAFSFFYKLFKDTLLITTKKTWQTESKVSMLQLLLNISSFVGLGASFYLLFINTMNGTISIGAFAAVFASLNTIFWLMDELVSGHLSAMNNNVGKVANYVRLLDIDEIDGDNGSIDLAKGIVAEGISFSYPRREDVAVKNVSISIAKGETIAIVGENGAGKSTLVRLLIGLYRPTEGKVTIGRLDTCSVHPSALFSDTSGVFQQYQRYKMTLADNVSISETENEHGLTANSSCGVSEKHTTVLGNICAKPEKNEWKIKNALENADFNEDELELDTMLSPEFDGVDLSGGQWQRVAIARGLYRANGVIVLDEPTSSIDPIEEVQIYNQFRKLTKGKIAIIVTHRLGSTKLADKVIVMDRGQISAVGTHDQLMISSSVYSDMWKAQSKWYENV